MNDFPCDGCGISGFPDFIIPFEHWKQISPNGDDSGMLCPSCICRRLAAKNLECIGAFVSGPIKSVTDDTIRLARDLENLTLAINGRKNAYGVRLDDRISDWMESRK